MAKLIFSRTKVGLCVAGSGCTSSSCMLMLWCQGNSGKVDTRKVLGDRHEAAGMWWAHVSFGCLRQALQNQGGAKLRGPCMAAKCVLGTRTSCLLALEKDQS